MDIPKIKFKQIKPDDVNDRSRSGEPSITLYYTGIYLPKATVQIIKNNNYHFASISAADSFVVIEFSKVNRRDSFEIKLSEHENVQRGKQYTVEYGRIGSKSLAKTVSDALGLTIDKNRYYRSCEYKIDGDLIYFRFDRNEVHYSNSKR